MAKQKKKAVSAQRGQIITLISIVVVLLVVAALILVKLNKSSSSKGTSSTVAPSDVVAATTGVPESAFAAIGYDSALPKPSSIKETSSLTKSGLPEVLYMGADYCPYCAAQRWAIVSALSRFGSFQKLGATSSGANDVYPNTQTFSFYGSSYSSKYIAFEGVEMQTNIASNGSYTTLQTPTAAQNNLLTTWDKPPYTPTADGIPFVDFANKYVLGGASYNPGLLQGLSLQTIAGSLSQPTSAPAKAIIGTANIITATVCKIDNNQPSNVCNLGYIQQIEKTLK